MDVFWVKKRRLSLPIDEILLSTPDRQTRSRRTQLANPPINRLLRL